jgi:DNA-directed RNA polymerase specialized sigma24 family protein
LAENVEQEKTSEAASSPLSAHDLARMRFFQQQLEILSRGDSSRENTLMRYCQHILGQQVSHDDLQDVTSEARKKALGGLQGYKGTMWDQSCTGDCKEKAAFLRWLSMIARNESLNYLRDRRPTAPLMPDVADERDHFGRISHIALQQIIRNFDPAWDTIDYQILIRSSMGCETREIAQELQMKLRTVQDRIAKRIKPVLNQLRQS